MMEQGSDDACFDAMFNGVSFSMLLSSSANTKPLPEEYSIGESSSVFPATNPMPKQEPYCFFSEDFPALSEKQATGRSYMNEEEEEEEEDQRLMMMSSVDFTEEKLQIPKCEPMLFEPIPKLSDLSFHQLPDLRSLEQVQHESARKRVRHSPPADYTLEAIVRSFMSSSSADSHGAKRAPIVTESAEARVSPPAAAMARKRRQNISEKTKALKKLMPWEKKMNMATMLEEAYKYVKFLQAQIMVLQSMPCESSFPVQVSPNNAACEFGALGNLNRQELLHTFLNSPVAQTMMYSQGCCVFSIEQLISQKRISDRSLLMQQQHLR